MLKTTYIFICFWILFNTPCSLFAQKYKYGKVTKELLTLKECDFHPGSDALITYVIGETTLDYEGNIGFLKIEKVKKQVKIFKSKGLESGNTTFYYYSPKKSSDKVKLRSLKGVTYNLENDKIEETKLTKDNIHETQIDDFYKKIVVTMPKVVDNSVFEIEYVLESPHFRYIGDWDIQNESLPTLYNEYFLSIPTYFNFRNVIRRGKDPIFNKNETAERFNSSIGRNLNYMKLNVAWDNIPPFEKEPFMTNPSDYQSRVTNQLIRIEWPNELPQIIASSWDDFNNNLIKSEYFGQIIKNGDFIKEYIPQNPSESKLDLSKKVLNLFQSTVKWNENNHFKTDKNGKKLFKEGIGDTGDINLNYIAALRELGIETYPIILSTRGHGTIHPIYPDESEVNYVIAASTIDAKVYYSDASSKLPFGSIPLKCLNLEGYLIDPVKKGWQNLKKDASGKYTSLTHITKNNESLIYEQSLGKSGYFAISDHESYTNLDSDTYKSAICTDKIAKIDSFQMPEVKIDNIKIKSKSTYDFDDDDIIYIKPFNHLPYNENPFTRENRISIVDFPFKEDYRFISTIQYAENEEFEPIKNENSILNDKWITFKYMASNLKESRKIQIVVDFKINKTEYTPEEYFDLKAAFESIMNKLNEPVIIKKIK